MKLFGSRKNAAHIEKKEHKISKTAKILLIMAACLLVLAAGAFAAVKMTVKPPSLKTRLPVAASSADGSEPAVQTEVLESHREGVYNVLVCGTDNDGFRTDTIIIAHLDCNTHAAALMSIPRDAALLRGDRLSKINSVYANGKEAGMERLAQTLEGMLGFPMDAYVLIDLNAFQQTVDLLGGVWFDVPQDMFYEDPSQDLYIDLKQGYQLLDGEHAMELVRYRKGYASQDIQRTSVQQDFLFALTEQYIDALSISKLSGLAAIFKENVLTDMTVGNLIYFASEIQKCDKQNIRSYTVEGAGVTVDGTSYYPLFDWSILSIVNESFNPYERQITAADISVVTPELAKQYDTSEQETEQTGQNEQTEQEEPPVLEETQDGIVAEWGYDPMQPDVQDGQSAEIWNG